MKALALALLLAACASAPRAPISNPVVIIDASVTGHLRDVQKFFPDEQVFCLLGNAVGHFIVVNAMQVGRAVERTGTYVRYMPCSQRDFIGMAHNHPSPYGCAFSRPDSLSFAHSGRAIIDVVVADAGCIKVRVRNGHEVTLK